MEELKDITKEKYDAFNNLYFTANGKPYKISHQEALKLVYTLYDSLGLPYTEPDRLADIIDERGDR